MCSAVETNITITLIIVQILYYDHWLQISKYGESLLQGSEYRLCARLCDYVFTFLLSTTLNPRSTGLMKSPLSQNMGCNYGLNCRCNRIHEWQALINQKVTSIPEFSSIVS